jgi:hypothetical protein
LWPILPRKTRIARVFHAPFAGFVVNQRATPFMLIFEERPGFPLLCVSDETQAVFRAYSAVCAPGFFVGFNTLLPKAPSEGGLDVVQKNPVPLEVRRSLSLRGA